MVSLALYRGNLHRVSDAPRQWQMPPRAITLSQFRILTQKREKALARLAAAQKNPKKEEEEVEEVKVKEEDEEEEGEVKNPEVPQPQSIEVKVESKEAEDRRKTIEASISAASSAAKGSETATTTTTTQVNNADAAKEERKIELEKKLEHLKQKKHHLVQMLKQILNAEEEIKRRNAQSAALRSSIPLQTETVDMGSATRHVPKLSVEVNFSGDLAAESDATTNNSAHGHHMHQAPITSPSATSLRRPFQQNMFLSAPRPATSGHGQMPSNVFVGNNTAAATSSPSRFAPAGGNQGHHHSASLPPPVPGSHFMASSPSPAASGGASSAFRDARLTSSS